MFFLSELVPLEAGLKMHSDRIPRPTHGGTAGLASEFKMS